MPVEVRRFQPSKKVRKNPSVTLGVFGSDNESRPDEDSCSDRDPTSDEDSSSYHQSDNVTHNPCINPQDSMIPALSQDAKPYPWSRGSGRQVHSHYFLQTICLTDSKFKPSPGELCYKLCFDKISKVWLVQEHDVNEAFSCKVLVPLPLAHLSKVYRTDVNGCIRFEFYGPYSAIGLELLSSKFAQIFLRNIRQLNASHGLKLFQTRVINE